MEELIKYMATRMVDHPDDVTVKEVPGEKTSVFELRVHKEDLGKVIGKQGRTARALRSVLNAAAAKLNKRVMLEIGE